VFEIIEAMILVIAIEIGIPPYLALSIALEENQALDPLAVHINTDGSRDLGIMQLNNSWFKGNWQDPETNIRAGCEHIKWLLSLPDLNVWESVVCYNSGYQGYKNGPPQSSIEYACRVFYRWNEYRGYRW
jgi:soluble lytic murein transglycosylase-like protein